MNLAELQKKLIAAARADVPGDQVPYAFEKRVMALLASRVAPDNLDVVGARTLARGGILRGGHAAVRRVGGFHADTSRRVPPTSRRILRTRCWPPWTKAIKHRELLESHSGHVVIFGAGVMTGGLLVNHVDHSRFRPPHRPEPRLRQFQHTSTPGRRMGQNPPPRLPEMMSRQFLQQLDEALHLTPEQHETIEKIIADGQEPDAQDHDGNAARKCER